MEASTPQRDLPTASASRKALTIGAVCKILGREFDDVSISKIRYLEDQKLLSPRRTPGGYRLYSQADVERLRSILRMQRDEFLPLRVIRQELSRGTVERGAARRDAGSRRAVSVDPRDSERIPLDELTERAGINEGFARELEDYGILQPAIESGKRFYDDTDVEIARSCMELSRFGVAGRNLRVFRTAADREAALIEQLVAPSLQSSNQARRREALENLSTLASVCASLQQLLLARDLRRLTPAE